MRVAVAGFPKAGKTTSFPHALHTDDVMAAGWEEASDIVRDWLQQPSPNLCVEGVRVPHALRKLKEAGKPCPIDKLVFFDQPRGVLTPRQRALGLQQRRIVLELGDWLPKVEWR